MVFPTLPYLALELEIVAYLAFAGVFTYLYVRELTGSIGAGMLSGVTFSLCGFLTSYPMLQMIILQVAVWLPAGLWLLERGLRRRSLLAVALAGVAYGCGVLGGHFQTYLYMVYLTAAYLLFRAVQGRLGLRFTLAAIGTLGLVAVGVAAPQLLPSAEIVSRSTRGRLGYDVIARGFALAEWWGLLRQLGAVVALYVGLVALGLAGVALVAAAVRLVRRGTALPWPRGQAGFWAAVAAVSLLVSLGKNGFLYPILYRAVPGFALFRQQERAAFLVAFALAVLAGFGLSARWAAGCAGGAALPGGGRCCRS